MTDPNTYLQLRRGVNRKRATCADPNLKVMYETLSTNLLNLYDHPTDPDFLARLPENVRAIEQYIPREAR
jgi:hypothetical protein